MKKTKPREKDFKRVQPYVYDVGCPRGQTPAASHPAYRLATPEKAVRVF
jgi:hypothetical protein